jgi:prepilin-type processing-associated H-X9-DG protein
MSIWLKKRLALWFGGTLAVGIVGFGGAQIMAQNRSPKTPEEAAQLFGRLLAVSELPEDNYNEDSSLRYWVISKQDRNKLGSSGVFPLLTELQKNSKRAAFDTTGTHTEGKTVVVDIAPAEKPISLPVVVIQEDGNYVVDLVATYAKRMKLEEGELQSKILVLTGAILPGLPNANAPYVQERACQTRLKELQLGILQYVQDYDEKLPPANKWSEVVFPYVQSEQAFNCPAVPGGKGGYAMNNNLTQQNLAKLNNVAQTVSLYETSDLRPNAFGIGQQMAFRHMSYENQPLGSNIAYMDGHVQFLPATRKIDFSLTPPIPKLKR